MKRLAALALCCGCGRVDFDLLADATRRDAVVDARKYFVDGGECPPGYSFVGTGCYRNVLNVDELAWLDAEAACEADVAGAHLVVIDDSAEAVVVDSMVPGSILDHWIGASDRRNEGVFLTVHNQPLGFATFDVGEPGGGMSENCLLFNDNQTLHDGDCALLDDYVCEYDGIPADRAAW